MQIRCACTTFWHNRHSIMRNSVVPAAKRVHAELLEFAAPQIAEVVFGGKNFLTAAEIVRRSTLSKQLGSGSAGSCSRMTAKQSHSTKIWKTKQSVA